MASLVGAIFDDYSTLQPEEINRALSYVGDAVSFTQSQPSSTDPVQGSKENDVFFVDSPNADLRDTGGTDMVIATQDYEMAAGLEHLIIAGDDNLAAEGNTLDNVMAGNSGDNLLDGGQGEDKLLGGAGNDTLIGGTGEDTLDGGSGNDSLQGDAGDDSIFGGEGQDTLIGGAGKDSLDGGAGDDSIFGGGGADTLIGGMGNDTLFGGAGSDVFYFGDTSGNDMVTDFDPAHDLIHILPDINGTGITSGEDVLLRSVSDGLGNTVIDLGNGYSITLLGVDADTLDADIFIVQ